MRQLTNQELELVEQEIDAMCDAQEGTVDMQRFNHLINLLETSRKLAKRQDIGLQVVDLASMAKKICGF